MTADAAPCIRAKGLRKRFGQTVALDGVDLQIGEGRILGLMDCEGELEVLGRRPWDHRDALMQDVCFIADVAVLPRWMRVSEALDYVEGVHPKFSRPKAEGFLWKTDIKASSRIGQLSKGMVTQLHLALVMAIDARLLVLDEPTLGLDILYRKQFYDTLLNDYFDGRRTILVTTHQVEEVQHILTDLAFINRGRIVLSCSMEALEQKYVELAVHPDQLQMARTFLPIYERQGLGRHYLLFEGANRSRLASLGELRSPSIADLFIATMGPGAGKTRIDA